MLAIRLKFVLYVTMAPRAENEMSAPEFLTRRREELLLVLFVLLSAFAAAVRLYAADKYAFVLYGDAASHLVKARQLIDSWQPGIQNIGTVWLPIPHLVLLPFSLIDSLFVTGTAGPVVGIPLLIGTVLLLFGIVRRLTHSRPIALLGALTFGVNPNIVYLSLTPMSEPVFFFLIALSGYCLFRWMYEQNDRWMIACAVAVMLSTLSRYEAWVLAPCLAVVLLFESYRSYKNADRARLWLFLLGAFISLAGILLWFLWNKWMFGDFFQFAPWKYRPPSSAANFPMRYRQESVTLTLVRALLNVFGPIVMIAGLGGIAVIRKFVHRPIQYFAYLFLALPALFIFAGILTDFVLIDQWWWNWRFVLVFGVFAAVAGSLGISRLFGVIRSRFAKGILVAALLAMPVVQLTVPDVSVATHEDAAKIFSGLTKYATAFGEKLGSVYSGGTIVLFTGGGLGERIMLSSGIPLKNFHPIVYPGGCDIGGAVMSGDSYIVLGKVRLPDSRQVVDYWMSRKDLVLQYYEVKFEDDKYLLLKRK